MNIILTFGILYFFLAIITVALLLLLLLIILIRRRHKQKKPKKPKKPVIRHLNAVLRPIKKDELRQIIIPDGIGGVLEIERLILMEQGLLIIESNAMSGILYGAEQVDHWTQIINGRSFKFANPLRHVRNARQALKLLAPQTPIYCRVIFTADTEFPMGKPDEVSVLNSLEQDMAAILQAPSHSQSMQSAWEYIVYIARDNEQAVLREAM